MLPDDIVMETADDDDAIGPAKPKLDRAVERLRCARAGFTSDF